MIQEECETLGIMKEHSKTLDFLKRRERARQERLDVRFRNAWRDFDRIVAKAEELTDFPLDIVEMEKIAPKYRKLMKSKGKLVYGSI